MNLQNSIIRIAALYLIIMSAVAIQAAESLSVLLQKGIFAEETEGNLEAAIKIYEGIVKDGDVNRSLVAQAQYRLGVCQLKRGKKDEAEAAFSQLVARFSDQTEIANKSRERLAELGKPYSAMAVRQIWNPAQDTEGSVSPDGKWLSFVDWKTGDLAIRNIKSGDVRHLTNKGGWEKSQEFAESSLFAPNGKQLAYSWFDGKTDYELRLVSLEDSERWTSLTQAQWATPASWSRDGKSIVAVLWQKTPENYDIALISIATKAIRILKSCGAQKPDVAGISFDDRYLVYSTRPLPAQERDIFVIDLSTGKESSLLQHPSDDVGLVWAPGGSGLLFSSDRRGTIDLWWLPVASGKAAGEPVLIKTNFGIERPLGITSNGVFYYSLFSNASELYLARMDFETGKILSPPKHISRRFTGVGVEHVLSPDFRFMAYHQRISNRPRRSFHILDLETSNDRELPELSHIRRFDAIKWKDNDTLLIAGLDIADRSVIQILNRTKHELLSIETNTDLRVGWPNTGFDGNSVYYVQRSSNKSGLKLIRHDLGTGLKSEKMIWPESGPTAPSGFGLNIEDNFIEYIREATNATPVTYTWCRRDLDTGREIELIKSTNAFSIRSPWKDKERLGITETISNSPPVLRVFDLKENRAKERFSVRLPEGARLNEWLWDNSRRLVFLKQAAAPGNAASPETSFEVWTVSGENGELKKTDLAMSRILNITRTPESNIIVVQRFPKPISEIWSLENFLPEREAAR